MECPFCRHNRTEVYNSRQNRGRSCVWRRRRCTTCHTAFTTYETIDLSFLSIVDKDADTQPYRRTRLLMSLLQAFGGKKEQSEHIDALADTIESELLNLESLEITTDELSQTVLSVLKRYEPSLFMRYLSQRDDLRSLEQLKQQLQELS